MAKFNLPFANAGEHRYPTPDEQAQGFPCGPVDRELFNGMFNRLESELGNAILYSGQVASDGDLSQITKAIRRGSWSYAVASGTANALTVAFNPALETNTEGIVIRVKIAEANLGAAKLNAGPGALPVKTMRGNDLAAGDLPAGGVVTFICTGTTWMLAGVAYSEFPRVLSSSLTLYIRPGGNDDNDGSVNTDARAFKTPQGALDYISRTFASGGNTITINLADGTYPAFSAIKIPVTVSFVGNESDPSQVIVDGAAVGQATVTISSGSSITMTGITVRASNSNTYGLVASGNSTVYLRSMRWADAPMSNIVSDANAAVTLAGDHTLYGGNHVSWLYAQSGGTIVADQSNLPVVNVAAQMAYSTGFVVVSTVGFIGMSGALFVDGENSFGRRYFVGTSGVINTGGGGPNFFPGSQSGDSSQGAYW